MGRAAARRPAARQRAAEQRAAGQRAARRLGQVAALRAQIRLLRYLLDNDGSTASAAARALQVSVPTVSRLVTAFRASGVVVPRERRPTGRRGPWSLVLSLSPRLGCSIGIDFEATRLRGVIVDFANAVRYEERRAIPARSRADAIVRIAIDLARRLVGRAKRARLTPRAIGLGLPGPIVDVDRGQIETELQFGKAVVEFVPAVEAACGIPVVAAPNTYCFAVAHHRFPREPTPGRRRSAVAQGDQAGSVGAVVAQGDQAGPARAAVEMLVLVRFGIGVAILWDGRLYRGASHAGDLGLLRSAMAACGRRYVDLCTGSSLLRLERQRGGRRTLVELMQATGDPLVGGWLETAVPAFAEAVFTSIVMYGPDRTVIEGVMNLLPLSRREEILERVYGEVDRVGLTRRPVEFFEGDDLMGARGAALLARDQIAAETLEAVVRGMS
jgi:glucokinase